MSSVAEPPARSLLALASHRATSSVTSYTQGLVAPNFKTFLPRRLGNLFRSNTSVQRTTQRYSTTSALAEIMGSAIGKSSTPVPDYDVLGTGACYELRAYAPYVVAEVAASEGSEDDRFRTLAKFIGVFGNPANKAAGGDTGESIAMTAPVVTDGSSRGTQISMTAPVVSSPGSASTMQFIMPKKYKSVSDLPTPTDSRVSLREVPEKVYLVHQFSGNMGTGDGHDAIAEREMAATVEGVAADGGAFSEYVSAESKYLVARYDPPWTLPFLRTNELWFPLPLSRSEAAAKLPSKP